MEPFFVPLGNTQLVAGLHWQEINPRIRFRKIAKENEADFYVGVKGEVTLLGTLALNTKEKHLGSLALQVLPKLPTHCYAVFALANGQYWLICSVDGVLSTLSDIVGDADSIKQVANTFLASQTEPDEGWSVIAPTGFFDNAKPLSLSEVLGDKPHRHTRLKRTHDKRIWVMGGTVLSLSLLGFYGYQHYQDNLHQARIRAAQAALKARQALINAGKKELMPWGVLPSVASMVSGCEGVWQSLPLSIAGWVVSGMECTASELRVYYVKPPNVTVSDFAKRLGNFYPDAAASFNIPGAANVSKFTLPMAIKGSGQQETLPNATALLERFTSFAQHLNAPLKIIAQNSTKQDSQGQPVIMPYQVFAFTFDTAIPPNRLFADNRFDDTGIRVTKITVKNTNNRLFYTLEGQLYAAR